MKFEVASFSETGPRLKNEDACGWLELGSGELVACIADGVGSKANGQAASRLAVDAFLGEVTKFDTNSLSVLLRKIHDELLWLNKEASDSPEQSGFVTTFTAVLIDGSYVRGVHVGDSRAYLLRGNGLKQLSTDQTEAVRLVREGKLPKEDLPIYPRRNLLEGALGSDKELHVEEFGHVVQPDDRITLSTDGVHDLLSKKALRDLSLECCDSFDFVERVQSTISDELKPRDNYTFLAIRLHT